MMAKKRSSYGRAPPRSRRSQLIDKGYQGYNDGQVFTDHEVAQQVSKRLHKKGYQAQVVALKGPAVADSGMGAWVVMYRGG
jgi:hypothetical protein